MTYVPRSPRRSTTLKAVVGGSERGRVRDISTSGLFLETHASLPPGAAVAVVPLLGELDGERLPAQVARVGDDGLALRFVAFHGAPSVEAARPDYYASDCPMAGHQIESGLADERPPTHPLRLLRMAYGI